MNNYLPSMLDTLALLKKSCSELEKILSDNQAEYAAIANDIESLQQQREPLYHGQIDIPSVYGNYSNESRAVQAMGQPYRENLHEWGKRQNDLLERNREISKVLAEKRRDHGATFLKTLYKKSAKFIVASEFYSRPDNYQSIKEKFEYPELLDAFVALRRSRLQYNSIKMELCVKDKVHRQANAKYLKNRKSIWSRVIAPILKYIFGYHTYEDKYHMAEKSKEKIEIAKNEKKSENTRIRAALSKEMRSTSKRFIEKQQALEESKDIFFSNPELLNEEEVILRINLAPSPKELVIS